MRVILNRSGIHIHRGVLKVRLDFYSLTDKLLFSHFVPVPIEEEEKANG